MASDHVPACFGLNRFLWEHIKSAGILGDNYGGLTPIVPIQEEPELMQAMDEQEGISSFPYLVYSWYSNGYDPNWFQQSDQVIYVINAENQTKLRELIILINKLFKRWDESAQAVNDFVQNSDMSDLYKRYHYKNISVQASTGGNPTAGDDEPIKAQVTIRLAFTDDSNDEPLPTLQPPPP